VRCQARLTSLTTKSRGVVREPRGLHRRADAFKIPLYPPLEKGERSYTSPPFLKEGAGAFSRGQVGPGLPKLSHNYYPTRDRATITKASPNWVAPTSYVGVAQRQEAMTIRHRRYYLYASHVLYTRIASCAFGTRTYDVPATHRGTICPLARLLRQSLARQPSIWTITACADTTYPLTDAV
jgi:hypothetical protein